MNKYEMTLKGKQEILTLAVLASKAYGEMKYSNSPRFKGKPEDRKVIKQKSEEAAGNLQKALEPLSPKALKELTGWMQRQTVTVPADPKGNGMIVWDSKKASELSGAFLSVVNALRSVHGEKSDLLRHPQNQATSTVNWIKACNRIGYCPRHGMTYEDRTILIRKLNELMEKAKADGNRKEALELNDQAGKLKNSTMFLKPAKTVELPKYVTLNADTSKAPETLGQVFGLSVSPVAEVVAKPAQSKEDVLRDKAFGGGKPKGSGKPPFVSARKGKKK